MVAAHHVFESKVTTDISESKTFRDVLKKCSYDTFIVLDLDNTTIESIAEGNVGSDQWFENLFRHANAIKIDSDKATQLILTLYHAVQLHIQVKPVEPEIVRIIKALQDIHVPILAFTARSKKILEPTLRQLAEVDISFARQFGKSNFEFVIDGGHIITYCDGIVFCDGKDKGKCLAEFFKKIKYYPAHVLMLDDKLKHLNSVKAIVNGYGGRFEGIRCGHLDEKVASFEMKTSMQALIKMSGLFSQPTHEVMKELKIEPMEVKPR